MKFSKHIVWLTPGFAASEQDDSTTPTLQQLSLAIQKLDDSCRITIISIHFPFQKIKRKWNGMEVYDIGGGNKPFPLRLVTWLRVNNTLQKIHDETPIDLLHSFWYNEAALLAGRFSGKKKIPHICTAIGQSLRETNRYIPLLKEKNIFIIGESERMKNEYVKPRMIIPWGVESANASGGERTIDVMGAGSLSELKNYSLFLQIVSLVKKSLPGLKIIIAGNGPELNKLEAETERLGFKDAIVFTGQISRKQVREKMRQSKVFLHTSSYESYGYVFAEAAEAGCYLVSTPVGAIAEFKNSFSSDDKNLLAQKTISILQNYKPCADTNYPKIADCARSYLDLYDRKINEQEN